MILTRFFFAVGSSPAPSRRGEKSNVFDRFFFIFYFSLRHIGTNLNVHNIPLVDIYIYISDVYVKHGGAERAESIGIIIA